MYRGTTPKLTFTLSIAPSRFLKLYITAEQSGRVVFERTLDEVDKNDITKSVSFRLTQDETLALSEKAQIFMQARGVMTDGNAVASDIVTTGVSRILKEGAI